MTTGRGNSVRAVGAAVLLGLLLFGVLVLFAPDSVAFSPNNYGWNGIHGVASAYGVNFTTSLQSVPDDSVLVIAQPGINFSTSDVEQVRLHLERGGTVLVADKSGVADSLLDGLGSGITIQSHYAVEDPIYNWKADSLPIALVAQQNASGMSFTSGVYGIALDQPSPLLLQGGAAVAVAATSQLSYDVLRPNSSAVAQGPFVVAAAERLGKGTLVVVGDSQLLLNSEWTIADNKAMIDNLFANSSVFIDASHWTSSPLTSSIAELKAEFRQGYGAAASSSVRYLVALSSVVVALALVPSDGGPAGPGPDAAMFHNGFVERTSTRERNAGER